MKNLFNLNHLDFEERLSLVTKISRKEIHEKIESVLARKHAIQFRRNSITPKFYGNVQADNFTLTLARDIKGKNFPLFVAPQIQGKLVGEDQVAVDVVMKLSSRRSFLLKIVFMFTILFLCAWITILPLGLIISYVEHVPNMAENTRINVPYFLSLSAFYFVPLLLIATIFIWLPKTMIAYTWQRSKELIINTFEAEQSDSNCS